MEVPCEFIYDNYTYKCSVSNVEFTHSYKIAGFNGEHHRHRTDANVTIIIFESCFMTSFPKDLVKFFPNLAVVQMSACGLTEINKEDLRNYPGLIYLGIIDNELTHLPGDVFKYTPKMEFIDFCNNKISTIGPLIFSSLKHVYGVNLNKNKTVDTHWITNDETSTTKDLVELNNHIRTNCRPLESLKNLAAVKIIENINKENVGNIYYFGHRFDIPAMRRQAYNYMKDVYGWRWLDEEFMELPMRMISYMMKQRLININ